jgi:hypothetical protein
MQNQLVGVVVVRLFKGVKRNVSKGLRASFMRAKLWFSSYMLIVGFVYNIQR